LQEDTSRVRGLPVESFVCLAGIHTELRNSKQRSADYTHLAKLNPRNLRMKELKYFFGFFDLRLFITQSLMHIRGSKSGEKNGLSLFCENPYRHLWRNLWQKTTVCRNRKKTFSKTPKLPFFHHTS
jgi:hypothetical protein